MIAILPSSHDLPFSRDFNPASTLFFFARLGSFQDSRGETPAGRRGAEPLEDRLWLVPRLVSLEIHDCFLNVLCTSPVFCS